MQTPAFFWSLLIALSLAPGVYAQEQEEDFDVETSQQPSLQVQTQSITMPAGFELVTTQPRLIGHGFKAKTSEHTVALACVGPGNPASCGRVRHMIHLKDSLQSYFFGPTYELNNTEPSAARIKSFSKELNREFKNYRFPRKWRYIIYTFGGMAVLMTVPALGGTGFIVWLMVAQGDGQPVFPGKGKVVSMANSSKAKWPKMSDRVFFKYINFVSGNAGTRLKQALANQQSAPVTSALTPNAEEDVAVELYQVDENGETTFERTL